MKRGEKLGNEIKNKLSGKTMEGKKTNKLREFYNKITKSNRNNESRHETLERYKRIFYDIFTGRPGKSS